jgi:uncharacterized protein (TIGR00369 family)
MTVILRTRSPMSRALSCSLPLTEFTSPYAMTLGLRRDGACVTMPFADGLRGRPGFLHGGAISGLLENTAWVTVLEALPDGARIKPVTVTVDFMRGAALHVETYAEAQIVRLGRRIANVMVTAWQDDRTKPIAVANLKLMIDRD